MSGRPGRGRVLPRGGILLLVLLALLVFRDVVPGWVWTLVVGVAVVVAVYYGLGLVGRRGRR